MSTSTDSPIPAGQFVHLHTHSEYSPLDGLGKAADLVAAAASDGNPAIAFSDHGTLGGIWKLRKHAAEHGLKAIPAYEAYVAIGARWEQDKIMVPADDDAGDDEATKDATSVEGRRLKARRYEHLTIAAINRTGWHNLVALHNSAQDSRLSGKPRIDYDLLREHSEGLIVLTGCIGGAVAGSLARGDTGRARHALRWATDAVGHENVYVEVMDHAMPAQRAITEGLRELAAEFELPLVATNDAHFTCEADAVAHEAWLAVGTGSRLSQADRFKFNGEGHHLRTAAQMRELFGGADWWQEACDETVRIADRVAADTIPGPAMRLPRFDVPRIAPHFVPPAHVDAADAQAMSYQYLRHLISQGAEERYERGANGKLPAQVNKRLAWEVKVINDAGFADYFLIVHDVIEWARSDRGLPTEKFPNGQPGQKLPIRVGPGRGCLVGEDQVWTPEGYKQLRDVQVGDTVRTHTGALRQVSSTFRYDCDEELYKVRSYSDGRGATMTGDHKVLVARAELETDTRKLTHGYRYKPQVTATPEWVQAKDIVVGDLVMSPRPASSGTAPAVIDVAPLLPDPPEGVEYTVTGTEVIERVPVNKPYPHSVREIARASGVSRNVIQHILSTAKKFDESPSGITRHDPRSTRMRDRLLGKVRERGFASLSAYREHLAIHSGDTRYPHSATMVARDAGITSDALKRVLAEYPESGPIMVQVKSGSRTLNARQRLVSELSSRGFESFAEWDTYIGQNATYEVRTPRHVAVDANLLFLIGAWASNGWLQTDSDRVVGWAEQASTSDDTIARLVRNVWGLTVSAARHPQNDLIQYDVRSAAVRALFRHLAPSYEMVAQTKHLPDWVPELGQAGKRALLGGLWWGDGSTAGGRWQYTTSSRRLAHQVRDLLWAIGAPAGLDEDNRTDSRDEYANRSVAWRIRTTPNFRTAVMQFGWTDDHYVYQRVRAVKKVAPAGEVFDIEVPVDHSYMTDSYVVHNSAAGSEVSYTLGIVGVDPLANGLLFERFLDPDRGEMPDIDVDFEQGRRGEVLQFLAKRWGRERVAQVGTYGLARSKAAIKDAARVLELASLGNKLSDLVPTEGGKPAPFAELFDEANKATADFRGMVSRSGEDAQRILDLATKFENVRKTPGVHACGVLISDEPMHRIVPLRVNTGKDAHEGSPMVTEWEGTDIADFGLLKLDVLGLRNLDVISHAARLVEASSGEAIDVDALDPDDGSERSKRTWAMLRAGQTSGTFQLESGGMTQLVEDGGPDSLDDLSAIVALYRPGPLGQNMHHRWAARKRGTEAVDYSIFTNDPAEQAKIATVLDESLGIPIMQEQSMRLSEVVAGFDVTLKNRLRRAISKKKQAEIDELGKVWAQGAERIGFSADGAQRVWDAIKEAGSYQFNKCLTGDTELATSDGSRVSIEEFYVSWGQQNPRLRDGLCLRAVDHRTGQVGAQPVAGVHFSGVHQVYRVELAGGYSVRATANHRFLGSDFLYIRVDQMVPGATSLMVDDGALQAAQVTSITAEGVEPVYDVEMAPGTDHNFTANGIVSHNSHSTAYGLIGYHTAYLKANWPAEYAAAILATTKKDEEKRAAAIESLATQGIELLPPDINVSGIDTAPEGDAVRLGLSEIKGVSSHATEIIAERDRGGPYGAGDRTALADLAARVRRRGDKGELAAMPVNVLEALIEAGALDAHGARLGQMQVARAIRAHPHMQPTPMEWGVLERSARQRVRLKGVVCGVHPLKTFAADLSAHKPRNGGKLFGVHRLEGVPDGHRVNVVGVLAGWVEKAYRGGRFARMLIEGTKSSIEAIMWDDDRSKLTTYPKVGQVVCAWGQIRARELEVTGDDGETTIVQRRELTARDVSVVPLPDPLQGQDQDGEPAMVVPDALVSEPDLDVLTVPAGTAAISVAPVLGGQWRTALWPGIHRGPASFDEGVWVTQAGGDALVVAAGQDVGDEDLPDLRAFLANTPDDAPGFTRYHPPVPHIRQGQHQSDHHLMEEDTHAH